MSVAGNLVINLMGNTQHLAKQLARGKGMVRSFGTSSTTALTRFGSRATMVFGAVGTAAKKMVGVLGSVAMIFGQALTVGVGLSLAKTIQYDDAIRAAGARSRATQKEIADLDARARMLGRTTSFTASEVANLMEELGKGGFKVPEIIDVTDDVMNLARATGTEGTMAAEMMAVTMRVFGLATKDAGRVADVFTGVANRTLTSVEELAEGWKFAAKPAADLGMSLEETAAVMGTLSQIGLKGSIAGTAIRRLSTVSAAQADMLKKKFGIAFRDAAGNARPLIDVMADISAATQSLGSADRMTKFYEAFGLRGVTATGGLADNVVQTDQLVAALQAAGGEADKTAKQMDAGIGGSWRKFKSALEGMALMFGEVLTPGAMSAMDSIREAMNSTTDWISQNWQWLSNKIAEWILIAMTIGEFALNNFTEIAKVSAMEYALFYVKAFNQIVYFLTTVIPEAAGWFAENFTRIVGNAAGWVYDSFQMMAEGLRSIWSALLDWMSGKGFNPDFSGVKSEFKAAALDSFELPERVKGQLETDLETAIGSAKNKLGSDLQTMLGDRLDELHRMQEAEAAKKLDDTKPEDPLGKTRETADIAAGPEGTSDAAVSGAQMRGSAEALMTILNAQGGRTDEMQLAIQKKQLKEAKAAAEALKKAAKQKPVQINVVGVP